MNRMMDKFPFPDRLMIVRFKQSTFVLLLASIVGWMLTSCATTDEADEEKAGPQASPQIVGRIASVPHGSSFVLIQSYGEWRVADGTILTTRGSDERTANLLVTGEKLGQFAAADIQAGEVAVGDTVLLLPAIAPRLDAQVGDVATPQAESGDAGDVTE